MDHLCTCCLHYPCPLIASKLILGGKAASMWVWWTMLQGSSPKEYSIYGKWIRTQTPLPLKLRKIPGFLVSNNIEYKYLIYLILLLKLLFQPLFTSQYLLKNIYNCVSYFPICSLGWLPSVWLTLPLWCLGLVSKVITREVAGIVAESKIARGIIKCSSTDGLLT